MVKVLIVDDRMSARMALVEICEELGYDSMEAQNGKEAIEHLSAKGFNLVLMDIEMPVMNGFETVKHIRESMGSAKRLIPVVAITSHQVDGGENRFLASGFNNILPKPYEIIEAKEIIEKYVSSTVF